MLKLRFVRDMQHAIGEGHHRSGWPYALACLAPLAGEEGWLFDDFVEQRFCYQRAPDAYREPWIGIFHHPPHLPAFSQDNERLERVFSSDAWQASQRHLLGAIALSDHLAAFLSERLSVATAVVRHPTEIPQHGWNEESYLQSWYKWLVQIGWYLRNTRAAFHVPPLQSHRKIRLWPPDRPPYHWVRDYDRRVAEYWADAGQRTETSDVTDYPVVSAARYDRIMASHVILTEVFAASANNVVVECIARNTPVIVNRHPAVVEYLTADYPLYFDAIEDVPGLLQTDRVMAAHRFLAGLEKAWLAGDSFRQSVAAAVTSFCD